MRIAIFCALLLSLPVSAAPTATEVRHGLEMRYRHAATLKAAFYQRYSDEHGGGVAESGVVYFSRPGRMRWEYESPQQKLFLVDGANVWFYIPADRTASRAKMKQSSDWRTPIALLAGKADLGELCREIVLVNAREDSSAEQSAKDSADAPLNPEDSVLRCLPRGKPEDPGSGIREILFETNPHFYLTRVVIREAGNCETEFRFGNWEENIPIPELKFHFQPPPGVSIVDEQALA
ncbi:MAG: LolA family protein, partial [Candidatus Acidiferrales bacterium]